MDPLKPHPSDATSLPICKEDPTDDNEYEWVNLADVVETPTRMTTTVATSSSPTSFVDFEFLPDSRRPTPPQTQNANSELKPETTTSRTPITVVTHAFPTVAVDFDFLPVAQLSSTSTFTPPKKDANSDRKTETTSSSTALYASNQMVTTTSSSMPPRQQPFTTTTFSELEVAEDLHLMKKNNALYDSLSVKPGERGKPNRRLLKERETCSWDSPWGIFIEPDDNLFVWNGYMQGPDDSPWADCLLPFHLVFPDEYPLFGPEVSFAVTLFHPNIYPTGHFCFDKLGWSPYLTGVKLLVIVQSTLGSPDASHAANAEAAESLIRNGRQAWADEAKKKYVASTVSAEALLTSRMFKNEGGGV